MRKADGRSYPLGNLAISMKYVKIVKLIRKLIKIPTKCVTQLKTNVAGKRANI